MFLIHFALSVSSTSENSFSPETQNKEWFRQIYVAKREQRTCWSCAGFMEPVKRLDRKGKLATRCKVIQMTMTSVWLEVLPENNKRQQNTSVIFLIERFYSLSVKKKKKRITYLSSIDPRRICGNIEYCLVELKKVV